MLKFFKAAILAVLALTAIFSIYGCINKANPNPEPTPIDTVFNYGDLKYVYTASEDINGQRYDITLNLYFEQYVEQYKMHTGTFILESKGGGKTDTVKGEYHAVLQCITLVNQTLNDNGFITSIDFIKPEFTIQDAFTVGDVYFKEGLRFTLSYDYENP